MFTGDNPIVSSHFISSLMREISIEMSSFYSLPKITPTTVPADILGDFHTVTGNTDYLGMNPLVLALPESASKKKWLNGTEKIPFISAGKVNKFLFFNLASYHFKFSKRFWKFITFFKRLKFNTTRSCIVFSSTSMLL